MNPSFETDPYPGRPRILFVGSGESSHTHSWIDLLENARFNVRLFALTEGIPPHDWPVRTYITSLAYPPLDSGTRVCLHPRSRALRFIKSRTALYLHSTKFDQLEARWLAGIVRQWQPHVIHTLGLDPAGELFHHARKKYQLEGIGKWVLQTRGGSDLALSQHDPERSIKIAEVLRDCDQLISDNHDNFRIARALGITDGQLSDLTPVPGTGGIDVDELANRWHDQPSSRRTILWPKAYEVPWSKVLPVYEALKICWERIQPCNVEMLATNPEARQWYWTLPAHIRERCHPHERISRAEVLELMVQSRTMLAPSLVDGVPNSMYEAMAAGAIPIVSPLDTIRPLVEEGRNVLFARNLYPDEIAAALVRAMTDDALVDSAAQTNLELVRRVANRTDIRRRVVAFYTEISEQSGGRSDRR